MIHIVLPAQMEFLHINGHSIKIVDRKLCKREFYDGTDTFLSSKLFTPSSVLLLVEETAAASRAIKSDVEKIKSSSGKKYSDVLVDNKAKKRKILKRPKRFKNYYSDRMPLNIPSFSFPRSLLHKHVITQTYLQCIALLCNNLLPTVCFNRIFLSSHFRLGEQFAFRGRQTICKYYDSNEIINNQLIRIKSATTAVEFERIFNEQHRYKHGYSKSVKSVEPYFDTQAVLEPPLRATASETCLCAKEFYRLDYNLLQKQPATLVQQQSLSTNAIKRLTVDDKGFNAFLLSASECYDTCIQYYLNDLNSCNQKADFIARQSSQLRPTSSCSFGIRSLKLESKIPDEITNKLRKLSINLEKSTTQLENCARQSSTSHRSFQAMSCSDTNNNHNTESTNVQLKDPPKIICSDFSSAAATTQQQSDTQKSVEKDFSSDKSDKNCLKIPHSNYCSEARPP